MLAMLDDPTILGIYLHKMDPERDLNYVALMASRR
jgi:hypothetical protein